MLKIWSRSEGSPSYCPPRAEVSTLAWHGRWEWWMDCKLWRFKGQFSAIFVWKSQYLFQLPKPIFTNLTKISDMGLSPAYFPNNSKQYDIILKHLRRYCRRISHGKPTGHVCRPAAFAAGRPGGCYGLGKYAIACTTMKMIFRCPKWTLESNSGPRETPIDIKIA